MGSKGAKGRSDDGLDEQASSDGVAVMSAERNPLFAYFDAIESARFDDVVQAFAPTGVYVRPPMAPDSQGRLGLVELRGHDEIAAFLRERGPRPDRHRVYHAVFDGRRAGVEGLVEANESIGPGIFMANATYDDDGLITRYCALAVQIDEAMDAQMRSTLTLLR